MTEIKNGNEQVLANFRDVLDGIETVDREPFFEEDEERVSARNLFQREA